MDENGSDDAQGRILMIAGFGDNASLFEGLAETGLARRYRLIPHDMPGFGAPALAGETTLAGLADNLADAARNTGARIVLAHSVASIVASLAAAQACPLDTILSVEGNITADDAYFSGTAAEFDDPESFRDAFLARLGERARGSAVVARYRDNVAKADPRALWQLGRDARRFSEARHPGDVLIASARVSYLYDPPNCPQATLDWIDTHPIDKRRLPGASHWPSVDAPELLSRQCLAALDALG